MAGILDKALGVGIGLLVLFILTSTLIMPQFSHAWRYCQVRRWNADVGGALGANCSTPYTNANTTEVVNRTTSHTEDGLTSDINPDIDPITDIDSFCLNCDTPGGYRTTVQGLTLLALVLAFISFALIFFPKKINVGM